MTWPKDATDLKPSSYSEKRRAQNLRLDRRTIHHESVLRKGMLLPGTQRWNCIGEHCYALVNCDGYDGQSIIDSSQGSRRNSYGKSAGKVVRSILDYKAQRGIGSMLTGSEASSSIATVLHEWRNIAVVPSSTGRRGLTLLVVQIHPLLSISVCFEVIQDCFVVID